MFAKNFVPIPFLGTNSLAFLSESIDLGFHHHKKDRAGPFDVMAIATFLSSCPVLLEFSLAIRKCRDSVAPSHDENVVMLGVKKVAFTFFHCNSTVVKSFLDVVRFPDVHRMELACNSREEHADSDMQYQKIVQVVLPDADAFRKLDDLFLEICAEGPYDSETERFAPKKSVSTPFSSVPNLRALAITTWETLIEPVPEGIYLPKLKSLDITNCWMMKLDWFLDMLRSLLCETRFLGLSIRHKSERLCLGGCGKPVAPGQWRLGSRYR